MVWKRKDIYSFTVANSSIHSRYQNFENFCCRVFFYPMRDEMRLSLEGLKYLECFIPSYKIESKRTEPLKVKDYLYLAKFCRKPYYIKGNDTIYFFDEEEAFVFKLCDGDIDNVCEVSPEPLAD